ncbi:unnamed protein product [Lactuca virosa]|uniref:Uncharacterized protein n=1 Tax=Lactuca virosa TaxID=75947 RepID=A0AAU9LXV1_9ASTR|nr:unnamed protein product [Lactuca virosa]
MQGGGEADVIFDEGEQEVDIVNKGLRFVIVILCRVDCDTRLLCTEAHSKIKHRKIQQIEFEPRLKLVFPQTIWRTSPSWLNLPGRFSSFGEISPCSLSGF